MNYTRVAILKMIKVNFLLIFKLLLFSTIIFSFFFLKEFIDTRAKKKQIKEKSFKVDFDINYYLESYYSDLDAFNINYKKPKTTIIKYSILNKDNAEKHYFALSFGINNDEIIEIYINYNDWKRFDPISKMYLMYHELSHDVLNMNDLSLSDENIGKLMYPIFENKIKDLKEFNQIKIDFFNEIVSKDF